MLVGGRSTGRKGIKGRKTWDNYNSIINKIHIKKDFTLFSIFVHLSTCFLEMKVFGDLAILLDHGGDGAFWKKLGPLKILWDTATMPALDGLPCNITERDKLLFFKLLFFSLFHLLPNLILKVIHFM